MGDGGGVRCGGVWGWGVLSGVRGVLVGLVCGAWDGWGYRDGILSRSRLSTSHGDNNLVLGLAGVGTHLGGGMDGGILGFWDGYLGWIVERGMMGSDWLGWYKLWVWDLGIGGWGLVGALGWGVGGWGFVGRVGWDDGIGIDGGWEMGFWDLGNNHIWVGIDGDWDVDCGEWDLGGFGMGGWGLGLWFGDCWDFGIVGDLDRGRGGMWARIMDWDCRMGGWFWWGFWGGGVLGLWGGDCGISTTHEDIGILMGDGLGGGGMWELGLWWWGEYLG
ncbi:hypothetical protein Tco_0563630 [Tanacetum coccineum]